MTRCVELSASQDAALATAGEVLALASRAFGVHGKLRHVDMLIQAATADAGLEVEEPNRHSEDHWDSLRRVRATWDKPGYGMIERGATDRSLTAKGREAVESILAPLMDRHEVPGD